MTRNIALKLAMSLAAIAAICGPASAAQIDHVILGIDDLDQGVKAFEAATGVRPVYGGKHPGGTHNALVSLGDGIYLEILAVQQGVTVQGDFDGLKEIKTLAPIGWAVSSKDTAELRNRLSAAGIAVSEPVGGSRTTPTGSRLSWQSFLLNESSPEVPFFIVWSEQTAHPSTTSPSGCKLQQWSIASPRVKDLEQLRQALDLRIDVAEAKTRSMRLSLTCPKGAVTF
jgi:Glyoxalase-like domain